MHMQFGNGTKTNAQRSAAANLIPATPAASLQHPDETFS
jgi:hypothetical protein